MSVSIPIIDKQAQVGAHARADDSAGGKQMSSGSRRTASSASLKDWMRLLRVHQYAKNALVFVPLLAAHKLEWRAFLLAFAAFIAYSLCASAVYIINDIADIAEDREHPTKRTRPLAAGLIATRSAVIVAGLLLCSAVGVALLASPWFLAVLAAYFALTTAYTYSLKRKMLVDVVVLATLYTIRVIGGAVAVNVEVSEWLLGFSLFVFTALALIKRYTELSTRLSNELADPSNRNYKISDLPVVAALAAAAAFNAVTVFALYVSSDAVKKFYSDPKLLWLICPILMYWLGRALMLAHRGMMHDDPIVFALKDWRSHVCAVATAIILLIAA